jgi:hypothetical protein
MRVDRETVWEAYGALLRYVRGNPRSPVAGASVPEGLTEKPSGRALEACSDLAFIITREMEARPLEASPLYYTYLFLFVQLLRVSHRYGPHYVSYAEGWAPLAWFPLHILRGSDTKAERAWHRWYYKEVQTQHPKPTEETLWHVYPLPAPFADVALVTLEQQLPSFLAAQRKWGLSLRGMIVDVGPGGHARPTGSRAIWHPWLIAALPETWESGLVHALPSECVAHLRLGVQAMLNDTQAGLRFVKEAIPLVNHMVSGQVGSLSDRSLIAVRGGIGAFVHQHLPGRQGHWRTRIRRHFPDNKRLQCVSTEGNRVVA